MLNQILANLANSAAIFILICVGLLSAGCAVSGGMWRDLSHTRLGPLLVPNFILAKRNREALAVFAVMSWTFAAVGLTSPPRHRAPEIDRKLDVEVARRLIGEWQQAVLTKNHRALDGIMAENFILEMPRGAIMTKVSVLSALPSESFHPVFVRDRHTTTVKVDGEEAVLRDHSFVYVGGHGWADVPPSGAPHARVRYTYRRDGGAFKLRSLTLD